MGLRANYLANYGRTELLTDQWDLTVFKTSVCSTNCSGLLSLQFDWSDQLQFPLFPLLPKLYYGRM